MFCENCGNKVEGMDFCTKCGTKVRTSAEGCQQPTQQDVHPHIDLTKKKKKTLVTCVIAAASVVIVALILFLTFVSSDAQRPPSVDELLSLGEQFLLDGNYEQALIHFMQVIEIEPMNPRGYTGAAEAYVGLGEYDRAREVLEDGLLAVGDDARIRDMLDSVNNAEEESRQAEFEAEVERRLAEHDAELEQESHDGAVRVRNFELILSPKYNVIESFSEGLAAVGVGDRENRIWGFIDINGDEAITPRFSGVQGFSEGRAVVHDGDLWGVIDTSGREIIPPRYDRARAFSEGRAAVGMRTGGMGGQTTWGFIDTEGNAIIPMGRNAYSVGDFSEGLAFRLAGGRYSFIDIYGNRVFPHDMTNVDTMLRSVRSFSEGLAGVSFGSVIHQTGSGLFGFIDTSFNVVIPPRFIGVGEFSEGFAAVAVDTVNIGRQWGFIDVDGNEIVPLIYDMVEGFSEGLAVVRTGDRSDGLSGYVDSMGNEVAPLMYDWGRCFSNGMAAVRLGDYWGFIDTNGNEVVPPMYDYVGDFSEGLAVVRIGYNWRNYTWALINTAGEKFPVEIDIDYLTAIGDIVDGVAIIRVGIGEDQSWGLIRVNTY